MRVQKAPGHVYSRQNNTETPDPLHTLPISPDLCVILTFKDSDDPLKAVAHKNTADMYRSFQPRVRAFLTNPVPQEASRTWGMQVLDAAETNQHGTPVFMSLMKLIEDACPLAPLLAYANADILFDNRLLDNLDALLAWNQSDVLAVGSRSNHDLQGPLTTDDISIVNSELFIDLAQDYFIMSRDTVKKLKDLPAYVIGRRGYDNALVDWAYHSLNLVDLTQTLTALHQTTSDGNYAGHSPSNIDKEYNVQLPNAQYDHGSTSHAQYYSLPHNGRVAVMRKSDNTMVIPEKGRKQQTSHRKLQLYLHGKQVEYEDLPSPLLVTFGNAAYREILANFLCNTLTFAPMHAHTLVIVTDQQTVDYLAALDTDVFIGLYPSEMQQARDYDTPGYTLLMLLRGQLLLELLGSRVIVWMEADAEYFGNILDNQQIASASTDLVLYWDGTMYGGGFIRFAATEAAKSFYAAIVSRMQAGIERRDFTDDQIILQDIIKTTSATHSEFDRCQFRSGRYYRAEYAQEYQKQCKDKRPMVQQHNWVVGNAKKIEMAKRHDAWFLQAESQLPVCSTRDLRVVVMTMDRPASLQRLLTSLENARYQAGSRVDLQVSVDRREGQQHDARTLEVLREFQWSHGFYEILLWPEPVGIYGQWVDSWPCEKYPANLYKAVVLLEDDLEVSQVYHEWFLGAHQAYSSPEIGAVTGMRAQLVAKQGSTMTVDQLVPHGLQVFAYRLIATWSMSPTYDAWKQFRAWVKNIRATNPEFDPAVDGTIPGSWYRTFKANGQEAGMWEIWFLRFMHDQNLYTVYPWIEDGTKTVVCNWREPGLHFEGTPSRDFPLIDAIPEKLLTQQFVPYVDWEMTFSPCMVWRKQIGITTGMKPAACYETQEISDYQWQVWMSPATQEVLASSCISATSVNSCHALAHGPTEMDLELDEQHLMLSQRGDLLIHGPAFVHANGDITDCTTETVWGGGGCGNSFKTEMQKCPLSAEITIERAVVITQQWGEGYFHLVVEGLTRLVDGMQNYPSFFDNQEVYVHTSDAGRASPILQVLGMKHIASGSMLVTKQLLSPRPTPCGGHRKSMHAKWLRKMLPVIPTIHETILFIQRSGTREILNHNDLIRALPGNVRVHTGHEPIIEQLQMFADARIVIGPHGSGMANIMAMSENNSVVELQVAPANHCYMFLAFNLGLRYHAHYEPGAVHDGKWSVDIAKVLQIPVFMQ